MCLDSKARLVTRVVCGMFGIVGSLIGGAVTSLVFLGSDLPVIAAVPWVFMGMAAAWICFLYLLEACVRLARGEYRNRAA